jgi:hypothetical protein
MKKFKQKKEFLSDPQRKHAYLVVEKKKPVHRPIRRVQEEFVSNPWGAYRTEALKRFTRELLAREHEKIKASKIRKPSHQDAPTTGEDGEVERVSGEKKS